MTCASSNDTKEKHYHKQDKGNSTIISMKLSLNDTCFLNQSINNYFHEIKSYLLTFIF